MATYEVGSAELIGIFGIVFESLLVKWWALLRSERGKRVFFPSDRAEWIQMTHNHSKVRYWVIELNLTTFLTLNMSYFLNLVL